MLFHLFDHLQQISDFPGAGLFQYISFRAAAAALLSLLVSIGIGRRIIEWLQLKQDLCALSRCTGDAQRMV